MSAIPVFDLGVWNAWIFMIWLVIPFFLWPLKIIPEDREKGSDFTADFSKMQKNALISLHIIYLVLVIYSVFVPLKLASAWFYIGLPISLLGLVPYVMVFVGFATTSPDKPITRGIYRYSRHPMYVAPFLAFLGVGIAIASWIFLLLSIVYMIMPLLFVEAEESFCLKQYGNIYRKYVNRTPRWIGIPKSIK